jgi:hypothetical protein
MTTIDFEVKRGTAQSVTFALTEPNGSAMNLTGLTVTLAVDGNGIHTTLAGTKDSPDTLGTGSFTVDGGAFPPTKTHDGRRIRPAYAAEIWVSTPNIPCGTVHFDVRDVPQLV